MENALRVCSQVRSAEGGRPVRDGIPVSVVDCLDRTECDSLGVYAGLTLSPREADSCGVVAAKVGPGIRP